MRVAQAPVSFSQQPCGARGSRSLFAMRVGPWAGAVTVTSFVFQQVLSIAVLTVLSGQGDSALRARSFGMPMRDQRSPMPLQSRSRSGKVLFAGIYVLLRLASAGRGASTIKQKTMPHGHYGFHRYAPNLPFFHLIAPFAARPGRSHRNTNPKRNIPCVALQNS